MKAGDIVKCRVDRNNYKIGIVLTTEECQQYQTGRQHKDVIVVSALIDQQILWFNLSEGKVELLSESQ
jgi:uncharacterized protein YijF (DUF1287 family)